MEKIIKGLEKQVESLEKVCNKFDAEYRKDSTGYNYGKALHSRTVLAELKQQIENLKEINSRQPLY